MKNNSLATGASLLGLLFLSLAAFASDDSLTTALFAKVSNGYVRQKLPNGSFKHEYYALSNGGYTPGLGRDGTIDAVPFSTIGVMLIKLLAKQHYYLAQNSKSAELLLVVSWGKTIPLSDGVTRNAQTNVFTAMNQIKLAKGTGSSNVGFVREPTGAADPGVLSAAQSEMEGAVMEMQLFNSMREKADESNARLLGYMQEINERNNQTRFAGAGTAFNDLIEDIESERYYVIVAAYDFRAATQEKKQKLLWTTRISIQAQHNKFDEALAAMLATASHKFGQESGGLIRRYQTGYKVEYGELKNMGIVPKASMPDKPAEEK